MMQSSGGRLPKGYREVEYVERRVFDSHRVGINTGFKLSKGYTFKFKIAATISEGPIWGSNSSAYETMLKYRGGISFLGGTFDEGMQMNGLAHEFEISLANGTQNLICITNGVEKRNVYSNVNDLALILFDYSNLKLWYHQIYYGDVLVQDLIPCVRISDCKASVFDVVSNTYFDYNNRYLQLSSPV